MSDNGKNTTLRSSLKKKKQVKMQSNSSRPTTSIMAKIGFKGKTINIKAGYMNQGRSKKNATKKKSKIENVNKTILIEDNHKASQKLSQSVNWKDQKYSRTSRPTGFQSSYLTRRKPRRVLQDDLSMTEDRETSNGSAYRTPSQSNSRRGLSSKAIWKEKKRMVPLVTNMTRVSMPPRHRLSSIPRMGITHTSFAVSRQLSPSPTKVVLQPFCTTVERSSVAASTNAQDKMEKHALYSQIRQLRNSVIQNEYDVKELGLYKQELAVMENEKLRTSLNFNRIVKEKGDLFSRLKMSEDRNQQMRGIIDELNSKLLTSDKTIIDLEDLVASKTQEKMDVEIQLKQLRERMKAIEALGNSNTVSIDIKAQLDMKTQAMKNKIGDLIGQNNKLRGEKSTYEMRITELETTISNLDGILTAKGIEYEGIHNMLNSNKTNLEVVLEENNQLRHQLSLAEGKYQSTETQRIDANNKVAELQHTINRLQDSNQKMEIEINALKGQNYQFSNNCKITQEDFNRLRMELSETQARLQVDTVRFKDRKKILDDEIRRLEAHLNQARNQVCEEKRLRQESDAQIKSLVEDLNIERQKTVEMVKENQFLKNEIERLRLELKSTLSVMEEMKSKLGSGMSSVSGLKAKLQEYLSQISALKCKLSAAGKSQLDERNKSHHIISEYKQRIQQLEAENNNLWKENSSYKHQMEELKITINNLNSKMGNLNNELDRLQEAIKKLQREKESLEAGVRKLKEKNHDLDTLANELKTQISSYEALISSLENEISQLKSDNQYLAGEFERLKKALESIEKDKRDLESEIKKLKEENQDLQFLNNELEQKVN